MILLIKTKQNLYILCFYICAQNCKENTQELHIFLLHRLLHPGRYLFCPYKSSHELDIRYHLKEDHEKLHERMKVILMQT